MENVDCQEVRDGVSEEDQQAFGFHCHQPDDEEHHTRK